MGLLVTEIEICDFRNWERLRVDPHPEITVLVGPNAAGKTSVVEAIELLTATTSFRRPQWVETIRWGRESAHLALKAEGEGRTLTTELDIREPGRRIYSVNGKTRRRVLDVTGVLPCVTFTPDDLRLVKESADRRRGELDAVGVQLSPSYARIKQDYEKVVRQRNALLKGESETTSHAVWDEQLIELGTKLATHRMRLFSRLKEPLENTYRSLARGEELSATYVNAWSRDGLSAEATVGESMRSHLRAKANEEKRRRTTLVGPHRDDVLFLIEGKEARAFASQGQQRTIALAWKLAEVATITEIGAQRPILLLDDVMSELDETRRRALTTFVGSAAQTFVTTTNLGYFDEELIARSTVVHL